MVCRGNRGMARMYAVTSLLFLIPLDWVMKETTSHQSTKIRLKLSTVLEDLDYADDIYLLSSSGSHLSETTERLNSNVRKVGLKINSKKTKWMPR